MNASYNRATPPHISTLRNLLMTRCCSAFQLWFSVPSQPFANFQIQKSTYKSYFEWNLTVPEVVSFH